MDASLARKTGKARIAAVVNAAGDLVRIDDVVRTLDLSRPQGAKLLARWAEQGWLRRVGRGVYVPVSLDLLETDRVVQDAWILVPPLFAPAYIGGRSAGEHWDLTEQIFRDTLIFTARKVRKRTVETQGAVFTLKHVKEELIFGTKTIWRGQTRISVSDVHRTIVDMLDDPSTGGGIQHVADCLTQYFHRKDRHPDKLIAYADRLGNGAVFKRLGFLAERNAEADRALIDAARERMTSGNAKLDPALDCKRLITRWRLRVPAAWLAEQRQ